MEPDSSDLPTPPIPVPPAQPPLPNRIGDQPRVRPAFLVAVATIVTLAGIMAVLFSSLFGRSDGMTTLVPFDTPAHTVTANGVAGTTATAQESATPSFPPSVHVVTVQATATTEMPVIATCPSGELALSGGWTSSVRSVPILYSKRVGNGWEVSPISSSRTPITVYVICLQHVAGATIVEQSSSALVAAGSDGQVTVLCDRGEIIVGVGVESGGVTIVNMEPDMSLNGIAGYAHNNTSYARGIAFAAECLRAAGATSATGPQVSTSVPPRASVGLQSTCPAGSLLAGGGVYIGGNALVSDFSPSDNATWEGHATDQAPMPAYFQLVPQCLSFS